MGGNVIIGDDFSNQLVRDPVTLIPYNNTYTIKGLGGNDFMSGGIMKGGAGNDTYHVDNLSDVVNEEGNNDPLDTVYSYIESINLSSPNISGIEYLYLIGPADGWAELGAGVAKNGTGNSLNNTIYGNSLANHIKGEGGHDELFGNGGNDTLEGGIGNDRLIGFGGGGSNSPGKGEIDKLTGGSGADTFVLWAHSSSSKVAAYNDDLISKFENGHWRPAPGTSDFAHITDFNKNEDKIELAGPASNYVLDNLSSSFSNSLGISGTGIFLDQGLFGRELIGVIENVSANQLSLNSSAFTFV